jgi:hypothetical protein
MSQPMWIQARSMSGLFFGYRFRDGGEFGGTEEQRWLSTENVHKHVDILPINRLTH